jgi:hypothetical protein
MGGIIAHLASARQPSDHRKCQLLGSVARRATCTHLTGEATEARPTKGNTTMITLPAAIEEQINRFDRQRSLVIGISNAVIAAWCAYRLIWLMYLAVTFSGFFGSLIFSFVIWGVIGIVAAAAAVIFLQRAKQLRTAAEGTPSVTTEG